MKNLILGFCCLLIGTTTFAADSITIDVKFAKEIQPDISSISLDSFGSMSCTGENAAYYFYGANLFDNNKALGLEFKGKFKGDKRKVCSIGSDDVYFKAKDIQIRFTHQNKTYLCKISDEIGTKFNGIGKDHFDVLQAKNEEIPLSCDDGKTDFYYIVHDGKAGLIYNKGYIEISNIVQEADIFVASEPKQSKVRDVKILHAPVLCGAANYHVDETSLNNNSKLAVKGPFKFDKRNACKISTNIAGVNVKSDYVYFTISDMVVGFTYNGNLHQCTISKTVATSFDHLYRRYDKLQTSADHKETTCPEDPNFYYIMVDGSLGKTFTTGSNLADSAIQSQLENRALQYDNGGIYIYQKDENPSTAIFTDL